MKLSRAQWARLFDLHMGTLIIVSFQQTMKALARRGLVCREYNHDRWRLTAPGREALSMAPREFNPGRR